MTAWVNGTKITGNGANVDDAYNDEYSAGKTINTFTKYTSVSLGNIRSKIIDCTTLTNYENLITADFLVVPTGVINNQSASISIQGQWSEMYYTSADVYIIK